ncbi:hypothetical protein DFH09DRAFT_1304217 [Mycena vulgaris]|nr:hypothetical protein DFH09DRAFT_1304217 [Mycena vulgaris]
MSLPVHFLNLAPELHLSIISHLSHSDKRRLRLVCQIFNNLLIIDVPLKDLRKARKKQTIFLIEDPIEGLEFDPFIILKIVDNSDKSEPGPAQSDGSPAPPPFHCQNQQILLDIYYPKFMRNDEEDDRTEEDEWEMHIHMNELSLNSKKKLTLESTRVVESVPYDSLRGKLIKASAAQLRARFVCPECRNKRESLFRFHELFSGCGWPMPCPVCIGYGVAYDAKCIQDDQKELDKLWKEIDGMLAKDAENVKKVPTPKILRRKQTKMDQAWALLAMFRGYPVVEDL